MFNDSELLTLENVSAQPPKSVLPDATGARNVMAGLAEADKASGLMRQEVQGMVDGNQPFDSQELRDLGQGDRSNVNWGEARSRVVQKRSLFYDLIFAANPLFTVTTAYGKRSRRGEYGQIISEELHALLMARRSNYLWNMKFSQTQMVIHGAGPLFFRDGLDFRPRAMKRRNLLVPRGTASDESEMPAAFVRDLMFPDQLWHKIRNEEVATRLGWNPGAVRRAIVFSAVRYDEQNRDKADWEWMQEQLKNNSYTYRYRDGACRVVELGHAFVREFDDTYSHHIFDERGDGRDYLYSKVSKFKSLTEAICCMFHDVGNGDFHSVRGLGFEVFRFGEQSNRMCNSLSDGVIANSSLMWKATTASDLQKFQTVEIGPHKIFPPGLEPLQFNTAQNLAAAMQVKQFFDNMQINQIGVSRMAGDDARGARKTAEQVRIEAGIASNLDTVDAEHYLMQMNTVGEQIAKRACNLNLLESDPGGDLALEFQRRCLRRGVPRQALVAIDSVIATRTIGNGSPQARELALTKLAQFAPEMPAAKRKQYVRDAFSAITGNQEASNRYGPDLDEDEEPGIDASIAAAENTAFMVAGDVFFNPDQNHFIHGALHIKFGNDVFQRVSGGQMDPVEAADVFSRAGPHAYQHVQTLKGDPTRVREYEELNQALSELMKLADQVQSAATQQMEEQQRQAEEQAQAEQQSPEMVKVLTDAQRKDLKAQSDMQIKQAKTQQDLQLKNLSARQELAINDALAAQKVRVSAETE